MKLSLDEVIEATGGRPAGAIRRGPRVVSSFHTDSREMAPGGLFFALRGTQMDGARFVPDAVGRGAAAVVVDRPLAAPGVAVIVVEDPWAALYALAGRVLERVAPLVVGVTGSNGKTSTREMIAAALGVRLSVHRSEGNLNTETGVPLTILGLLPEHRALVLEMGMQAPGEIARLARLGRPRVGVVTSIGTVHMEFFAGREELARAKGELAAALPPDGLAVLNAEDPFTPLLESMTRARVTTFGLGVGDLRGDGYRARGEGGVITVRGRQVRLGLPGRHQARNALAALAVAEFAGIPVEEAAPPLARVSIEGRLRRLPGDGGIVIVDDAYNASPESMLAAFETLAERSRRGRLLGVLGEMRELGPLAEQAHREVGARAREVFDGAAVLDVGMGAVLAKAAGARLVPDLDAAERWVREGARPGDVVLIKASHGLRLDELVLRLRERRASGEQ
ncbi:MAG: UDP-N-acetylmuramoyl-tripeptide--D-alanyl-D-alanine ligase [Candidatus Dormibacteraceae bacterium]